MQIPIEQFLLLCLGFFVVATLYSSVGFGGGSSYLALLTLFLGSFFAIRSIALICNLVVVYGSTYLYFKNGHAKLKDFLPFIITSIPLAFLGASFRLKENIFFIILGISLILSATFLALQTFNWAKSVAETEKISGLPELFFRGRNRFFIRFGRNWRGYFSRTDFKSFTLG
ncbi:TSUP family transporter [Maribacter litopenaei]|uniref:Probable membrane transporter protein n=1 Tax=Maribacter litopenaei TaxID=2976127 RepID=A0ABY5YDP4_9FLAO|nr:TSUP family transporter [Maribacter litopenaei]UWX55996.1 TSUP family transporter [Maribacter litopenaei]